MPEGEKIGGASSKGWVESAPMVGLIDLSNIGVPVQWPPRPPPISDITVYKTGVRRNYILYEGTK